MSEDKKETIVETAKETAKEVVDTVKDMNETVVEKVKTVKEVIGSKKQTWWNRIWSAIVGAIVAVGAMFGITTDKVAEEKAKVESMQNSIKEIKSAIDAGNYTEAVKMANEAVETGKELGKDVKETFDNVKEKAKEIDKKEIGKTAVTGAIEGLKKADINNKAYTE